MKNIPEGQPTVQVPWAGAAAARLIPPEARGIGSRSTTDGLPAVRAADRAKRLHEGLQISHDVPAVRAPRITPACAAANPVEGRAHATLPAPIAGSSSASGRESTPALRGVLPPLGGDPRPGSPLCGHASCLRCPFPWSALNIEQKVEECLYPYHKSDTTPLPQPVLHTPYCAFSTPSGIC